MYPNKRFQTPKMRWLPKGTASIITELTIAQSLAFGSTSSAEKVDPLLDSLLFMYKMNEEGAQTDSAGSYDLTARNSPTLINPGKVGWGQQYDIGSICHYNAVGIGASNESFCMNLWVRSDSAPSSISNYYFNVRNATGYTLSLYHYISTNKIIASISPDSGTTGYAASSTTSPTIGTWYQIHVEYIQDTSLRLYFNNSLEGGVSASGGYASGQMVFGAQKSDGFGSKPVSLDAVHFWRGYVLDSDERAYMWNSGTGRELL